MPRRRKEGWQRNLPTKRQKDVLDAIIALTKRMGYSPTMRELGKKLDLSHQGVVVHLRALRDKGAVAWDYNKSRTLQALCKIDGRGVFFVPGALMGKEVS